MVPLASIIPIDLFENILFFVGDVSKLNPGLDRPARRIEMKHLSACSATCVYWANLTRQRMFTHLILQSYEDFCGLQTLLRAPSSSRIYSISALLRSLEVFYKLGDQSWFHSVAGLRASAAPRLHGIGLHIIGPPTPALTAATGRRSVLHPLYFSTPRLLPPTIFHDFYPDVFVEDIHLPNAAALFNLLQDCVSLLPWRLYCRNLTWDHSSRATPSSARLKAACRREYATRQMNSWGCTDDILVAFMTQSVPHHELSLRRLGPHLSFADTNHLFEAMIATGRQFTGEDGTPNPFWIESLCHVDSIQKYTAITLQPNNTLAFQWQASHFDFMCIASQRQNDISDVHDATYIIMELHHPEDLTKFEDGMRAVDWNAFLYAIRRFPDLSRIVIQHPAQHRESSRKYIVELISRLRAAWEEANDFLELHYYSYEDDSKHWTLVQLDTLLDEDEIKREEAQTRLQDNAGVAVGSE